jgi:hypothetical protein
MRLKMACNYEDFQLMANASELWFSAFPGHHSTFFPSDAKGIRDYNVLGRAEWSTLVIHNALSLGASDAP